MNILFYAVMFVCIHDVCDNHVVSEAKSLKECLEITNAEKPKYELLDKNVIASCVPNTDFE